MISNETTGTGLVSGICSSLICLKSAWVKKEGESFLYFVYVLFLVEPVMLEENIFEKGSPVFVTNLPLFLAAGASRHPGRWKLAYVDFVDMRTRKQFSKQLDGLSLDLAKVSRAKHRGISGICFATLPRVQETKKSFWLTPFAWFSQISAVTLRN